MTVFLGILWKVLAILAPILIPMLKEFLDAPDTVVVSKPNDALERVWSESGRRP